MAAADKNWAQAYINDPLTAPDPSDDTGLNSHFRPPAESNETSSNSPMTPPSAPKPRRLSKTNPYLKPQSHRSSKETSSTTTKELTSQGPSSYPSPPASTSPNLPQSPNHRQDYLSATTRPRRSSSLRERYPGDPSVAPLDQLTKEKHRADRAKHTSKKHAIRPDTIDGLDNSGMGSYHHEGPYDATLFARNSSWKISPVAAVATTNEEALRATPHEKIVDSVQRHRPLDGVAAYPPGAVDRNGQSYQYKEGENMMIEENAGGGPYKRWPGLQYHPDDIKGKGEPSYSIEKALNEHSLEETEGADGVEMTSGVNKRSVDANRWRSGSNGYRSEAFAADNDESNLERRSSLSNRLRKRVGSLKKKLSEE